MTVLSQAHLIGERLTRREYTNALLNTTNIVFLCLLTRMPMSGSI